MHQNERDFLLRILTAGSLVPLDRGDRAAVRSLGLQGMVVPERTAGKLTRYVLTNAGRAEAAAEPSRRVDAGPRQGLGYNPKGALTSGGYATAGEGTRRAPIRGQDRE